MSAEERNQGEPSPEDQRPSYGTRGGIREDLTPAGDGGRVGATDVTPGAGGYGGDRSGAPGGAPERTGGKVGAEPTEEEEP